MDACAARNLLPVRTWARRLRGPVAWSGCATTLAKRERANEALGNDTREFIGPAVPPLAHIDKDLP